jgi:hypothetical protein
MERSLATTDEKVEGEEAEAHHDEHGVAAREVSTSKIEARAAHG